MRRTTPEESPKMPEGTPRNSGKVKTVTSTANPLVKRIRALALKKNRDRDGVFLAEGRKLLTDAMEKDWEIDTVVCSRDMAADAGFAATIAKCRAAGADILEVSEKVLGAISRRDNPQTVIAVIRQRWRELRDPQRLRQEMARVRAAAAAPGGADPGAANGDG